MKSEETNKTSPTVNQKVREERIRQETHNKVDIPQNFVSRNSLKLIYDIQARPDGLDVAVLTKMFDYGYVFWDSSKGTRPKLILVDGNAEVLPEFVDTSGKDVNIEDLHKQWADEEFWRKELYSCRQSPLHYYNNYIAVSPRPTQEEIDGFLTSIGMAPSTDSDDASQKSEKLLKVREDYSKSITLEKIQGLRPLRDAILKKYNEATEALELVAYETLGVFLDDSTPENTRASERKLKQKIVSAVMKVSPKEVPAEYKSNIIRGRWDKKVLSMTEADVLLRMWYKLTK